MRSRAHGAGACGAAASSNDERADDKKETIAAAAEAPSPNAWLGIRSAAEKRIASRLRLLATASRVEGCRLASPPKRQAGLAISASSLTYREARREYLVAGLWRRVATKPPQEPWEWKPLCRREDERKTRRKRQIEEYVSTESRLLPPSINLAPRASNEQAEAVYKPGFTYSQHFKASCSPRAMPTTQEGSCVKSSPFPMQITGGMRQLSLCGQIRILYAHRSGVQYTRGPALA